MKGRLIERLVELTAGNPFYVQIIGDRLVGILKRDRLRDATTVELNEVIEQLTQGVNALSRKHFDNLVTASDDDVTDIKPAETWSVLRAVALGSSTGGSCFRSAIKIDNPNRVDLVLDDLVQRKVLESPQEDYYKIRVGLFREWLEAESRRRGGVGLMDALLNPFAECGRIVRGDAFFGRRDELERLEQRLIQPPTGGSAAIVGEPRIGKSSLGLSGLDGSQRGIRHPS